MIDDLAAYGDYKTTDAPWLGQVPTHWDVVPNRAIFREINDRGHPDEEMLSVTINRGVLRQSELLANSSKKDSSNQDKSNYKLVCPGDFAYNKMRAWQGAAGVSQYRGIVSPAYIIVRPHEEQVMRYFHYLFRTPAFAKEAERWSYGISSDQWSLRIDEFKRIYACVPPREEQAAIVRFLDHADRRIRRYIRAKRQLIALLNEQKQAIIHRAVTRGLDPNVRLKPSGVEWIGDVPEHWDVTRLRRLVQTGRRLTYGILKPGEYDPEGRVMVRAQDFSFGWTAPDKVFRASKEVEEPYARCRLQPGDLLYTIVGAGVGNVGVVPEWLEGASISRANARVAIDCSKAFPGFVALVLRSPLGKEQVQYFSKGSAQPVLNLEYVGAFAIPVPPLDEQALIVKAVETETAPFDKAQERAKREIEFLREYRTRLVADVVTGKLDVREAVERLPEEVEEGDLIHDDLLEDEDAKSDEELDAETEEVEA